METILDAFSKEDRTEITISLTWYNNGKRSEEYV